MILKSKQLNWSAKSFCLLAIALLISQASLAAPKQANPAKAPIAKPQVTPAKAPQIVPTAEKKEEVAKPIKNEVTACSKEITVQELVSKPESVLNKEVCFSGTFNSFSALALDYPPAMRERKRYISLTLLRPSTNIPLGELKLALKIDDAQKHEALAKIAEGDLVKIKGKVFSTALGEPWVDILQIQVTKGPNSKDGTSLFDEL